MFKVVPTDAAVKEKTLQSMSSLSSAQIVSATAMHNKVTAANLASLGLSSSAVSYTAPPVSILYLRPLPRGFLSSSLCTLSRSEMKAHERVVKSLDPSCTCVAHNL